MRSKGLYVDNKNLDAQSIGELMEVKKHMARIAGVDLPREKRVEIGLTYIYGIGRVSADRILAEANVEITGNRML